MRVRRLFVIIALIGAFASVRAETVLNVHTAPEADASIRLAVPWTDMPRFGFAPVRISIENHANRERTWNFVFRAGAPYQTPGAVVTDESITVAAGQTREAWVFVPVAEPGPSFGGAPGPGSSIPAVHIASSPKGKSVTTSTFIPGLGTALRQTEFDTVAGTVTTIQTPPGGKSTVRTETIKSKPGELIRIIIDPGTGNFHVRRRLASPSTAGRPAVFRIETGPGTTPGGAGMIPMSAMMVNAEVSGPGVAGEQISFPGASSPSGMRSFAISQALESALRAKLSTVTSGAPNLSSVDVASLPADWRVWSSFSGVILTTDEYAGLDAARRSALRSWVGLGGHLTLAPTSTHAGETASLENVGAGFIARLSAPIGTLGDADFGFDAASASASSGGDSDEQEVGLEEEIARRRAAREGGKTPGAPASEISPLVLTTNRLAVKTLPFFAGTAGLPDRSALVLEGGPLWTLLKDQGMANSWLAIFLVVFAAIVGPVNLFLFAPAKKRHRLFVTTPVIALAASVVLGITILVQDGIGGQGARRAAVVLLPGESVAAVVQEQASRTGLLTGRSFALPDDVALTILPLNKFPDYARPNLQLQRGNGRAGGDWFQSRAGQAHQLRRIVPTRARIEQVGTGSGGAPVVQSTLATTLRDFTYVDFAGEAWSIRELPAGQRVTLERGGKPAAVLEGVSANLHQFVAGASPEAPGHWLALGGATELAPLGTLGSIAWSDNQVLYAGMMENPGAKGGAR